MPYRARKRGGREAMGKKGEKNRQKWGGRGNLLSFRKKKKKKERRNFF